MVILLDIRKSIEPKKKEKDTQQTRIGSRNQTISANRQHAVEIYILWLRREDISLIRVSNIYISILSRNSKGYSLPLVFQWQPVIREDHQLADYSLPCYQSSICIIYDRLPQSIDARFLTIQLPVMIRTCIHTY